MDNHIVPECYIDTMLIETLVPPNKRKRYNHQHGCFAVSNEMEFRSLKDKFAVGIIDNDKRKAKYLKGFTEIDNIGSELRLFKKERTHHYYIEISPAIEDWILKVCKESGIDMADFDLPDNIQSLVKITKPQTSSNDKRFINLFLALKNKNNRTVLKLKGWIEKLKDKNYQIDINELKNG